MCEIKHNKKVDPNFGEEREGGVGGKKKLSNAFFYPKNLYGHNR